MGSLPPWLLAFIEPPTSVQHYTLLSITNLFKYLGARIAVKNPGYKLTCEYPTPSSTFHHSFSPFQLNPHSLTLIIMIHEYTLVFLYILQPMCYIDSSCFFQLLWQQQLVLPMALMDELWMKELCRKKYHQKNKRLSLVPVLHHSQWCLKYESSYLHLQYN